MSFFKKIFGGEKDSNELVGRFYDLLKRQGWHCLLNQTTCVIDKLNGRDVLVFERVIEEGEEIEAGETSLYKFILGSGMEFIEVKDTPCTSVGFSFMGTCSDSRQTRKFLFELNDPENKKQTEELTKKLKHLKTFNKAKVTAPVIQQEKNISSPDPNNEPEEDEILCELSDTEDSEDTEELEIGANPIQRLIHKNFYVLDAAVKYIDDSKTITDLFVYSVASRSYKRAGKITIQLASSSRFEFLICLKKNDNLFFHHYLDSGQHIAFVEQDNSIEWIGRDPQGQVWGMKTILTLSDFNSLRRQYTIVEWEMKNKSNFSKLKVDDQTFVLASIGGRAMTMDTSNDSSDYNEDYAFEEDTEDEETEDEVSEELDESDLEESDEEGGEGQENDKNSGLAVGFVSDRAFVTRGNKIGVFKITEDNQLEFSTTIDNIVAPGNVEFQPPSQMMLHEQDTKMLMLNENNKNSIMCMDMNRGEIVEEWKTSDVGYAVKSVLPESRLAQLETVQTFVGMNSKGAFRIDPRVSTKEKQMNNFGFRYQRSTDPSFSCAATTVNGDLIMGSNKGDVRLFSHNQIQNENRNQDMKAKAKNQLRLAGDPVLGVDVTMNGEWILATCETYLMVIPVKVDGVDGFEKSLTGDKRLPGRRLELNRDHLWEMGGKVSFTVAHFNRDYEGNEKSIVTSTGPYVITWDFRQVSRGVLNKYQIKQYSDNIVDEQFKFGEDKAIVVTLPDDVKIAKRVKK